MGTRGAWGPSLVGMELGSGLERSGTVQNMERPEHDASQSGPRTKDQGSRTKDHGPCFGTNEHPRRDTDVILRLSKSTIEDLPFYIGFTMELVVKMIVFDETMTFV